MNQSPPLDYKPLVPIGPLDGWRRALDEALTATDTFSSVGHIDSVSGSILRARGVTAAIGELCELRDVRAGVTRPLGLAEVIGLQGADLLLTSLTPTVSLSRRAQVVALNRRLSVPTGDALLGRVLDGFGQPIDDAGPLFASASTAVDAAPPQAMRRQAVSKPVVTGIRAIDGLLTCGQGQRVAIFSPAGAGKSSLLGALARGCQADVIVLALVGERGREVGDFVREQLGPTGMKRTVVLAATSDRPAIERIKCAQVATAIAEQFRSQGKHVLLLVDSITRLARAQREIALALGEPPARDGFPPSVFGMLAPILERAGQSEQGAMTAFYTVLTDDDRGHDPIAEEVRSIVDGHIVLSRELAGVGHFPAIDVLRSVSRVMPRVAAQRHQALAQQLRAMLAKLDEIALLLQVGDYQAGSDPLADRAIALRGAIERFLRQATDPSGATSGALPAATAIGTSAAGDMLPIQHALERLFDAAKPA